MKRAKRITKGQLAEAYAKGRHDGVCDGRRLEASTRIGLTDAAKLELVKAIGSVATSNAKLTYAVSRILNPKDGW